MINLLVESGVSLVAQWPTETVTEYFKNVLSIIHDNAKLCFHAGLELHYAYEEEQAKLFCEQVIKFDAYDSVTYYNKGFSYYILEDFAKAIEYYEEIIDKNAYNEQVKFEMVVRHKGEALLGLELYQEAIDCFNIVISSNFRNSEILLCKAEALRELGRIEQAEDLEDLADQYMNTATSTTDFRINTEDDQSFLLGSNLMYAETE